jgi:hypothetical protein
MTSLRALHVWRRIGTDGDLDDTLAEVRARRADHSLCRADQAELMVGEALCLYHRARFREATEQLHEAAHTFAELTDSPEVRFGRIVLTATEGAFAAIHGQTAAATAHFQRALLEAEQYGHLGLQGALHLVRADTIGHLDPRLGYADARWGADQLALAGLAADRQRGRRVLACAALAAGEPEVAIVQAEALLADPAAPPVEAARMRVVLGHALHHTDHADEATALVQQGLRQLTEFQSVLWHLEGLRAVIDIIPSEAARAVQEARSLLGDADPAVVDALLWRRVPHLALRSLGEQTISVDGRVVSDHGDDAARLIFMLAVASPGSLDANAVAGRLWPGKAHHRQASSLTTLTWEARRLLGPAAWRLSRHDDRLSLDLDGASFDLRDAATSVREPGPDADDAIARLRLPLLPAWQYDDWVIEAEHRRTGPRRGHP